MEAPDRAAAHRHFSAYCFNEAWKLLRAADRSREDDETMIALALASHWHWTQREDYTTRNAAIGYWQVSRVYAVLGDSGNAMRYGERSLHAAEAHGEPFYVAYACEALARAEAVAGRWGLASEHLARAKAHTERVPDPEERRMLLDDLATITLSSG